MSTQSYVGALVVVSCYKCGLVYGIPQDYYDNMKRDNRKGEGTACPNGHSWVFRDTVTQEAERLRAQLTAAREESSHYRDQRNAMERSRNAVRGQVTRIKKRIHAGVCIHCNRTFENLARHMKCKHADSGFKQPQLEGKTR